MVSKQAIVAAINTLSLLRFFPPASARGALAQMFTEMCHSDDHLDWLARQALAFYADWPGPKELRALYCSRFVPLDGIEAYSEDLRYVEGFPASVPAPEQPQLPPGPSHGWAQKLLTETSNKLTRLK